MKHPEHAEARTDRVAGLNGDHAGNATFGDGRVDVAAIEYEFEMLRVRLHESLDQVDLLESHLNGVLVLRAARSVSHPQLSRQKEKERPYKPKAKTS